MTTRLLVIFMLLSFQLSKAAETDCDTQRAVDEATALSQNGEDEAALNLLKTRYTQCPSAARLALEIGALYQTLGQSDAAIETWQDALNQHTMPDSVRVNVQLRILALQQSAPKPQNTDFTLRLGTRYIGNLDDTAVEALANLSRIYPSTHNNGKAQSQWRHGVSALSQQYLANDVQLNLLQASTAYRYSQQTIGAMAEAGLRLQQGELSTTLTLEPSLRFGQTKTAVAIQWRPTDAQWRITPSLAISGAVRALLSTEWRHEDKLSWRWHSIGSQLRWGERFMPSLSAYYNVSDQSLDTAGGLSLLLFERWTAQTQWRSQWTLDSQEHQWINSITWRGSL